MSKYHNYSLTELNNLVPYELELITNMLLSDLEDIKRGREGITEPIHFKPNMDAYKGK